MGMGMGKISWDRNEDGVVDGENTRERGGEWKNSWDGDGDSFILPCHCGLCKRLILVCCYGNIL